MKFSLEKLNNIKELIRDLSTGLTKLSFLDNFHSFEETIVIGSGDTAQIRNKLPFIPTRYIIVEQTGNGICARDVNDIWTLNYLYLKNWGVDTITVKIVFFK